MKRIALIVLFATFALATGSAYAQQTGGLTADNLYQYLSKQGTVTAEKIGADRVEIHAKGTGTTLCSVHFAQPQVVTLSRAIATLDARSAAAVRVMQAIAFFNFSSPVGTLQLDNATGVLSMEHNLNPHAMSVETMANVVLLFGRVADTEGRHFASLGGRNMGMLVR